MRTLRSMLLIGAGILSLGNAAAQNTGINDRDSSRIDRRETRRMIREAESHSGNAVKWTFGPKIGLNASSFSNSSAEHRLGPAAGVFFVYSHREHFGVTGDLLYSYKGAEWETNNNDVETKRSTQLTYIELPVQGMYYSGRERGSGRRWD